MQPCVVINWIRIGKLTAFQL